MGWTSYVFPYSTEDERKTIIDAMIEHNTRGQEVVKGEVAIRFRRERIFRPMDLAVENAIARAQEGALWKVVSSGGRCVPDAPDTVIPNDWRDKEGGSKLVQPGQGRFKMGKKKRYLVVGNDGGSAYTKAFFHRRQIECLWFDEVRPQLNNPIPSPFL